MESGDYRATALLTEHLGFAPLTLVDEVINAVNKIMYNCTDALETFLRKRRDTQLDKLRKLHGIRDSDMDIDADGLMAEQIAQAEKLGEVFPLSEIHHGTSELETLLVSQVDKNFDKFELYTLRNILTLPRDLVEGGWIRLKHHEHLDSVDLLSSSEASDTRIQTLIKQIGLELQIRKILTLKLTQGRKMVAILTQYKQNMDALVLAHANSELAPEVVRMIKEDLTPMNENVYYLLSQLTDLIDQVLRLNQSLAKYSTFAENDHLRDRLTNREMYLREKTFKLLEGIKNKARGQQLTLNTT